MACRTLLLKLQRRGQIRLPPPQRQSPNAGRNRQQVAFFYDQSPISGSLSALRPLRIEPLGQHHPDLALFRLLVHGLRLKLDPLPFYADTTFCLLIGTGILLSRDK